MELFARPFSGQGLDLRRVAQPINTLSEGGTTMGKSFWIGGSPGRAADYVRSITSGERAITDNLRARFPRSPADIPVPQREHLMRSKGLKECARCGALSHPSEVKEVRHTPPYVGKKVCKSCYDAI